MNMYLPAIGKGYRKKNLYELRELATRVEESLTASLFRKLKPNGDSKFSKKFRNRDTDEISKEKLSPNERKFLTNNIEKGGGAYVFPAVQAKWDWARKDKLC